MSTLFEINNVTLGYKGVDVLKEFSLSVKPGEIVALMGQSGSGKSTLLSSLHGFLQPRGGSIAFNGKDLYACSQKELAAYRNKSVGMVYQFFNLIPDIDALSNVMMPLIIGGIERKQAKAIAEQLLSGVNLSAFSSNKVCKLSGGQQQRVAIARALANKPQAILADEPTGSLDSESAETICKLLVEVCRTNDTALIVATHDHRVANYADRIIEL